MEKFEHVVALGAGRMGRGIAHMFAYAGYAVTMLDIKDRDTDACEALEKTAMEEIRVNMDFMASLDILSDAQVDNALSKISVCTKAQAPEILNRADIILEGVPETREAKEHALNMVSDYARDSTIVTSTTSTILVTELQELITHPGRFINTHFLNPAYLIPLVEVSPGPETEEDVVTAVMQLFEAIGKVPVRCSARPGYIIPRLQSLIMAEACRMVEEGVASPEDLDKAIMNGFGPRYATMGVMEFIDWGGVDILYYAGHYLSDALNSPAHAPPEAVTRMMEDGRRGMREGHGYYDFSKMDVEAWQKQKLARFVSLLKQLDQIPDPGC